MDFSVFRCFGYIEDAFVVHEQGYHGDTSKTFYCGNVSDEAKKLVEVS